MLLRNSTRTKRRGVALLVVLALLTLFAVVAITFVYFSEGENVSAGLYFKAAPSERRYDNDDLQLAHRRA